MKFSTLYMLLALVFFAACTSTPETPTLAPTDAPTDAPVDTASDPSEADSQNPNGDVQITGDVTQTLSGKQFIFTKPGTPHYELSFYESLDYLVYITLPAGTTPGTYDISATTDAAGQIGAEVTVAREPGKLASSGAVDYNEGIDGTITIDQIGDALGDAISGQFEFSALATDSGDSGGDVTKTITVTGTFDGTLIVENE